MSSNKIRPARRAADAPVRWKMPQLRAAVQSPEDGMAALALATWGAAARPPEWMTRAACRNSDPELFAGTDETGEARATCKTCPVRRICLADQERFEAGQPAYFPLVGVVGGLTGPEREERAQRLAQEAANKGEGVAS